MSVRQSNGSCVFSTFIKGTRNQPGSQVFWTTVVVDVDQEPIRHFSTYEYCFEKQVANQITRSVKPKTAEGLQGVTGLWGQGVLRF